MKSRCCLLITGTLCVWVFGYGVLEYVVGIHLYRQLFFVLVASILNSDHFLQLRTWCRFFHNVDETKINCCSAGVTDVTF